MAALHKSIGMMLHKFALDEQAIKHLATATLNDAGDFQLYMVLSKLCHKFGMLHEAMALAAEALRISTTSREAIASYLQFGSICLATGKLEKALLMFRMAKQA